MRFDPARTSGTTAVDSAAREVSAADKVREAHDLLRHYLTRRSASQPFGPIFEDLAEYDELLGRHANRTLARSKVFEIGFGVNPYRLIALAAMGVDVTGVDAEVPMVRGTPSEVLSVYRAKGAQRAARSFVRHTFFDRRERRAFYAALAERNLPRPRVEHRLTVADATALRLEPGQFDLIYSEDVFEHIAPDDLPRLSERMATWLRPGGIAAIRPNVFTGIIGGHLVEWNIESFELDAPKRRSQPWDHLRERRFKPNTYVNELTRADYRSLFSRHFEILEERVKVPDLGREYLTPGLREELSDFPEEELLSNQVLFVLRPR